MTDPELKYPDCEKALLATVKPVKYFSNYIGGQKVILEMQHELVRLLNSQPIWDGVVTDVHVASGLTVLQVFDMEVCKVQSKKNPLGTHLAACQWFSSPHCCSLRTYSKTLIKIYVKMWWLFPNNPPTWLAWQANVERSKETKWNGTESIILFAELQLIQTVSSYENQHIFFIYRYSAVENPFSKQPF